MKCLIAVFIFVLPLPRAVGFIKRPKNLNAITVSEMEVFQVSSLAFGGHSFVKVKPLAPSASTTSLNSACLRKHLGVCLGGRDCLCSPQPPWPVLHILFEWCFKKWQYIYLGACWLCPQMYRCFFLQLDLMQAEEAFQPSVPGWPSRHHTILLLP